jgi:F-type H+-transporting ATPase subunit epsilon
MPELRCIVVTPEKTELDTAAASITIPMYDGEMGILPGRAPMVGRLGYGLMTVKTSGGTKQFFVDGGFVQITRESVCVLTDRMLAPEKIDASQAAKDLEAANEMKGVTAEAYTAKTRAVAQARAKIRLAGRK